MVSSVEILSRSSTFSQLRLFSTMMDLQYLANSQFLAISWMISSYLASSLLCCTLSVFWSRVLMCSICASFFLRFLILLKTTRRTGLLSFSSQLIAMDQGSCIGCLSDSLFQSYQYEFPYPIASYIQEYHTDNFDDSTKVREKERHSQNMLIHQRQQGRQNQTKKYKFFICALLYAREHLKLLNMNSSHNQMIVLKKIVLLRSFLPSMTAYFSEKKPLSEIAQKAVWSTHVIRAISNSKAPKNAKAPSLCDKILALQAPSDKYEFSDSSKKEVMTPFTEGISLAQPFLSQDRRQGVNKDKFIFFPNYMVTRRMFALLKRLTFDWMGSDIITGGFGISKTVSIVLYIHLTYHQTKYVCKALKDQKMKQELDQLIREDLIFRTVPKYWYWSVANVSDPEDMKRLILKQAVELEQSQKQELEKYKQLDTFIKKLKKCYPFYTFYAKQYLTSRPIVDQISALTSVMREINNYRQKLDNAIYYPEKIKQLKSTKQYQNYEPSRRSVQEMISHFRQFKRLGSYSTLSSSLTIQKDLLVWGYRLNLDLLNKVDDSHTRLYFESVQYEELMRTPGGQADFWHCFWFEIERRLKQQGVDPSLIKDSKDNFLNIVNEMQITSLARFDYAGTFLQKEFKNFLIEKGMTQNKDEEKATEKILAVLQRFSKYCSSQTFKGFETVISKGGENTKKKIVKNLYVVAAGLIESNSKEANEEFLVFIQDMEEGVNQEIGQSFNLQDELINNNQLKGKIQLFECTKRFYKKDGYQDILKNSWKMRIRFSWTPRQFVEWVQTVLFPEAGSKEQILRCLSPDETTKQF